MLRNSPALRCTSWAKVAENMRVCLWSFLGMLGLATHRLTSGMKPMSSILSASSSTRNWRPLKVTWPRSAKSRSRPGVATRMLQPLASWPRWNWVAVPPYSSAVLTSVPVENLRASSLIWAGLVKEILN